MFKLIEPKHHRSYKLLIDPLLGELEKNPALSCSFQDYRNATFIIAQDDKKGIYGGALLLKKRVSSLYREVGENMFPFTPQNEEVWSCTVCIQVESKDRSLSYESFCKIFYRDLYEKLFEFGVKKKIDFFWMALAPVEYLSTKLLGFWPSYEIQVRPEESQDGLFHGILPLTRSQNKVLLKTWKKSDTPSREMSLVAC